MDAFTGMDTESVRQFGEVLITRAETIQRRVDGLRGAVGASSTFWVGADGDDFRMAHRSLVELPGEQLTAMLTARARELAQHADEQDEASAADEASANTGGGPGGSEVPAFSNPPAPVDGPPDGNPTYDPYIEDVWTDPDHPEYLDDAEKREFLERLVREELEQQGIEDVQFVYPPVRDPKTGELNNFGGYWSDHTDPPTLAIREDQLASTYAITTALHEIRHGIQYEMIDSTVAFHDWGFWDYLFRTHGQVIAELQRSDEAFERVEEEYGFTREEIQQWDREFNDYVGIPDPLPDNPTPEQQAAYDEQMEEYRNQAVEVDARTAAYEQGSGLSVEEFKRIRDKP